MDPSTSVRSRARSFHRCIHGRAECAQGQDLLGGAELVGRARHSPDDAAGTVLREGAPPALAQREHAARAVGAHEDLRVDLDVCLLRGGGTFLLCSDGLDKHVSQDEIAVHLARGDAARSVDSLLELVLSRGASDNVTMCAVNIR